MKVFIYGTLKRGQRKCDMLAGQQFLGDAVTKPKYRLYDLGDYPGLVADEDGQAIEGELWEVDDECLRKLDRIEGVPQHYVRAPVELEAEHTEVQTYIYQRQVETAWDCGTRWER